MPRLLTAARSICTLCLVLSTVGCVDGLDNESTSEPGASSGSSASSGGSASSAPIPSGGSSGAIEPTDELAVWPPGCPLHFSWSNMNVQDLTATLPAEAKLVGVTRTPDTGEIFVLLDSGALYQVTTLGAALVFEARSATIEGDAPSGPFTDVAAIGRGQFALTAPNDGYILDVAEGRMWQHFCYLPAPTGGPQPTSVSLALTAQGLSVGQFTEALAFDATVDLLWALPRTVNTETDEFYGLELASFDAYSGEPRSWMLLDRPGPRPGAISVSPVETVIGEGSLLSVYGERLEALSFEQDLADQGITLISGLAWGGEDPCDYSLLLVDETKKALFTLELRAVGDIR